MNSVITETEAYNFLHSDKGRDRRFTTVELKIPGV